MWALYLWGGLWRAERSGRKVEISEIVMDAGKKECRKRMQHHQLAVTALLKELELMEKGRAAQLGGAEA